jgi:hypothetical protein
MHATRHAATIRAGRRLLSVYSADNQSPGRQRVYACVYLRVNLASTHLGVDP